MPKDKPMRDRTPQMIKCPSCDTVQAAIVDHTTFPFSTYIHYCEKCEYIIMESEWDLVEPFFLNPLLPPIKN